MDVHSREVRLDHLQQVQQAAVLRSGFGEITLPHEDRGILVVRDLQGDVVAFLDLVAVDHHRLGPKLDVRPDHSYLAEAPGDHRCVGGVAALGGEHALRHFDSLDVTGKGRRHGEDHVCVAPVDLRFTERGDEPIGGKEYASDRRTHRSADAPLDRREPLHGPSVQCGVKDLREPSRLDRLDHVPVIDNVPAHEVQQRLYLSLRRFIGHRRLVNQPQLAALDRETHEPDLAEMVLQGPGDRGELREVLLGELVEGLALPGGLVERLGKELALELVGPRNDVVGEHVAGTAVVVEIAVHHRLNEDRAVLAGGTGGKRRPEEPQHVAQLKVRFREELRREQLAVLLDHLDDRRLPLGGHKVLAERFERLVARLVGTRGEFQLEDAGDQKPVLTVGERFAGGCGERVQGRLAQADMVHRRQRAAHVEHRALGGLQQEHLPRAAKLPRHARLHGLYRALQDRPRRRGVVRERRERLAGHHEPGAHRHVEFRQRDRPYAAAPHDVEAGLIGLAFPITK